MKPVRLKVAYKTPQALLSEFTRSVGKGGVALDSKKAVPIGTRFIFELHTTGVSEVIEVFGEVLSVTPASRGHYVLNIRYEQPDNRPGLDALLGRIMEAHKFEKARQYPRIPLLLRASEDRAYSPSYLVRDISRGGAGIEIETPSMPAHVRTGVPCLLEVSLSIGLLVLHGEVAWVANAAGSSKKWINPSMGVSFGKLRTDTETRLDKILSLQALPPPPWVARISFGSEAVSRMPGLG